MRGNMKKNFSVLFVFMATCFWGATTPVADNDTGAALEKRDYINETARRIAEWEDRIADLRVQRDNELRTNVRFLRLERAIARMETALYSAERTLNGLRGSPAPEWSHYRALIEDRLATVKAVSGSVLAE